MEEALLQIGVSKPFMVMEALLALRDIQAIRHIP
jgi:hypothetical protein